MRFTNSIIGCCAALGMVALAHPDAVIAQSGSGSEKIQYSKPSEGTVASNLNRLDPQQSTFKRVEDDLFKPFKPRVPVRFLFPPPEKFATPTTDRRTQEMIERRKNWAFADWNDLFPDSSADEQSDGDPEGRNKRPVSLIEKYMDNLDKKQQSTTNKLNVGAWMARQAGETYSFDSTPESYTVEGQMTKLMKQIILPHSADGLDNNVVDFKRADFNQLTAEQAQEQKRRSEEFQRMLDPHWEATQAAATNSSLPGQTTANNSAGQINFGSPSRNLNGPAPGVVDPTARAFYSHVYDDPTALALGLTNNLLTRPTTPALPPPTLQTLDTMPKRKF